MNGATEPRNVAELFRVAMEQGWAAFEAACRKTLADEWRLGFDAGARVSQTFRAPKP